MITVRYIYSACVVISTPKLKILCDPWFTEGMYDGSWFHFPKLENPIEKIGDVDVIYISHIHPDHYDGEFLRKYMAVHGKKPLLIANHNPNYLKAKAGADGFEVEIVDKKDFNDATLTIVPHKTGSISDIDSALVVDYNDGVKTHTVVNANDIIFDERITKEVKETAPNIDILLCGYTGAGPYPQTYYDLDNLELEQEAEKKKQSFFNRYKSTVSNLNPKAVIPFAGKYTLGGKLAKLNGVRGVADAVEVVAFDKKAVVLSDGGDAVINTKDLTPSSVRTELYSQEELNKVLSEISKLKMDYERLIDEKEIHQLPIKKLIRFAYKKALAKSEVQQDYFYAIEIAKDEFAVFNTKIDSNFLTFCKKDDLQKYSPRSEIYMDVRYLFGLMSQVYHWNNAEVGSQFMNRRFPNVFDRSVQRFLNYFTA